MLLVLLIFLVFLVLLVFSLQGVRSHRSDNPAEHRPEHASTHLVSDEPATGAAKQRSA